MFAGSCLSLLALGRCVLLLDCVVVFVMCCRSLLVFVVGVFCLMLRFV